MTLKQRLFHISYTHMTLKQQEQQQEQQQPFKISSRQSGNCNTNRHAAITRCVAL